MDVVLTLLGMLVVVAAILALAHYTTKWIAQRGSGAWSGSVRPSREGKFRILAQLNVGRGERLVLVRLQERCLLLGVTEKNITLLKELEAGEAEDWFVPPENIAPGFSELVREKLRKGK